MCKIAFFNIFKAFLNFFNFNYFIVYNCFAHIKSDILIKIKIKFYRFVIVLINLSLMSEIQIES